MRLSCLSCRAARPTSADPLPLDPDLTSNAVDAKDLETLATQHELADAWKELTKSLPAGTEAAQVHVLGSVQEAVEVVRGAAGEGKRVDALVAGSLHLVGGVLAVADLPL